MKLAFTICSNNFLGQAATMIQSLHKHHPDWKKYIFLVDEKDPGVDYNIFLPAQVIPVTEEVVPGFAEMVSRYTVMELNSTVRPFVIQYLASKNREADRIIYLDPDMFIYYKLDLLDELLNEEDIIVTPHFLEPIPVDDRTPFENLATNYGVYNLGFLALNPKTENVQHFLNWWGERTKKYGHIDVANGYFVDQIWFNLAPIFFERVYSLRHKGYNMAAWNLQERKISEYREDGSIQLESGEPLVIYHFSSWNPDRPEKLSMGHNRYEFSNRPDMKKLYGDYHQSLLLNKIDTYKKIPCRLPVKKARKKSPIKKALSPAIGLMRKVWQRI